MNPFGNKIFAVEFMQLAQSACERSLNYERLIMGAFFVFRQHDVVAVCPKGGKDAANKGKQATKFGRTNQLASCDRA